MLDRALEISPNYAQAIAQKALVTYLLSDALGAYGDVPRAVAHPAATELINEALLIDDALAEAYAIQGLLLDDVGMFEESVEAMLRALDINPNMSDAANWLANSYNSLSRREEAIAIYERIVARDPVYGPAFGNLTQGYMRTGDVDKAESLIARVQRIVGENDEVLNARGVVAIMRGESAAAVRNLRRVHVNNPNSSVMQMWYGFALMGIADYDTISKVGLPEHRMLAYYELGDLEQALSEMNDMDLAATFPQRTLANIGELLIAEGFSQDFIDYINERVGSVEALLDAYPVEIAWGTGYLTSLAYAHLQVGDQATYSMLLEEARKVQEIQREAGTENWVTWFTQAQYDALNGDVDAAIESLQTALDRGFRIPSAFESPIFASLNGEPRYDELVQRLAQLVDEERAKLGMPPYRPIAPTDEEKPHSSFVN
jgi:tetratricopeptide (TPR) repeat protein